LFFLFLGMMEEIRKMLDVLVDFNNTTAQWNLLLMHYC